MSITSPPTGACPERVTSPAAEVGPTTVAGSTEMLKIDGGLIVSVAVSETNPSVPVMAASVIAAAATVLTVNVAEVLPAAMKTLAGTIVKVLLLFSLTASPPFVAGPVRIAVPVDEDPPVRLLGFREIESRAGGVTVRIAL
jgi:hypothetical protein